MRRGAPSGAAAFELYDSRDPMSVDPKSARGGARTEDRWALTPEALGSLLDFLDPDPESAGRRYQEIRVRLARIFEWRGCAYPEELVDETMNRVAHKLHAGVVVEADDPFHYFCGVAFMVFKEVLRAERRERAALAEIRHLPPPLPEDEDDRMECLRRCIDELSQAERDLILRYYTGEGRTRIRCRQRLAADLDKPMNALRIQAFRLRGRLEECVRSCLTMK